MKIAKDVLDMLGHTCKVDKWDDISDGYYLSRDVFLAEYGREVHYAVIIFDSGFWILYLVTIGDRRPLREIYHGRDIREDVENLKFTGVPDKIRTE